MGNLGLKHGRASLLSVISHKTDQSPDHCSGTALLSGIEGADALPQAGAAVRTILGRTRADGRIAAISAPYHHSALVNGCGLVKSAAAAFM